MPTENYPGPIGEIRAVTTAGTGTALSTTPIFVTLPDGTFLVRLWVRNWTTTTLAARVALNPYLEIIKTTDTFATIGNVSDGSVVLQDTQSTTTFNVGLNTLAAGTALYIGSHLPFRGVNVTVGGTVNAIASVLSAKYWKNTNAWTSLAGFTDNTAAAGATLAQSGTIVWTVPTDWERAALGSSNQQGNAGIGETLTLGNVAYSQMPLYWLRFEVTVQLTAGTVISSLTAMNRVTSYWDIPLPLTGDGTTAGQAGSQTLPFDFLVERGPMGVGCIEAATQASTANLIVDVATRPNMGFNRNL